MPALLSGLSVPMGVIVVLSLGGCYSTSPQGVGTPVLGCDGQTYVTPDESPYVLPYAVGASFETGLTNCSSSYHASGNPDQYAFDFRMPSGTEFIAARAGKVFRVVEDQRRVPPP